MYETKDDKWFWLSQIGDFNKTWESQWQKYQACTTFQTENKFLNLECAITITWDINPIYV